MRWPTRLFVLLVVCFFAPGTLVHAQSDQPANAANDRVKPASKAATEDEVEQLRREVADLKATIQQLVQTNHQQAASGGRLVQANAADSASAPEPTAADIDVLQKEIEVLQKKAADGPPVTSGWN